VADNRATVRLIAGLTSTELTDDNIDALLELNDGFVRLAASDALETYAGSLITAVQSDDISLDGSKRASVLMARAARLRQQASAEADDGAFAFDVVFDNQQRPELTERSHL
jgi:hypothetical protein